MMKTITIFSLKDRTRYVQSLLIFLAMSLTFIMRVCITEALIAMTKESSNSSEFQTYVWDSSEKSLVTSSLIWGYAFTQIPSAYIANRYSNRIVLSSCMFVCGLIHAITPLLANFGWQALFFARVIMGLCQGCIFPSAQQFIANWTPLAERERLGTFVMSGMDIGTVIGISTSGLLAASMFGWPSIFYLFGGATVLWSIIYFYIGTDSPNNHPTISQAEKSYICDGTNNSTNANLEIPWKSIMTSLPVWALIFASCGYCWSYSAAVLELPVYLNNIYNFDNKMSAVLSSLPFLVSWLFYFPVSYLSDLAIQNGASTSLVRKSANTIAFCGMALAFFGLGVTRITNKYLILIFFTINNCFSVGHISGYVINHVDISPNFVGITFSITNTIGSIIAIIALLACGAIVPDQENIEQWHSYFFTTAILIFSSNCLYNLLITSDVQEWNEPRVLKTEPPENNEDSSSLHI